MDSTREVPARLGSRWDPKCVFNFLRFFERTLYTSNYIIFISSWCGKHTKIRSKLVDIVTAGSQKITLWGPQRTPLGTLRVKLKTKYMQEQHSVVGKALFNKELQFQTTVFCAYKPHRIVTLLWRFGGHCSLRIYNEELGSGGCWDIHGTRTNKTNVWAKPLYESLRSESLYTWRQQMNKH